MTNERKTLRWTALMIVFFLLLLASMIIAVDVGVAVSVRPILPKNQHDPEVTYYDLRMAPSQEQELILELDNTSDKEKKVTLQINEATTNDAGDIDYSDRSKFIPRDKSLKVSLKDIATTEPEITIPPKEMIKVSVHLKMPKGLFNGMVLGGIKIVSFEKNNETNESDNNKKPSKKTYVVAVKLTETDTPVEAELDLLEMSSSQESDKCVIKATLQNNQAVNLEDIEYTAKIYEKNSDKIVHQNKVTGHRMAPNSSFQFIIAEEKQKFQTGKYQVHLTAKSKDTGQEWKWDKELEITEATEKTTVSKASADKETILFYTVICVITFVFLLLLLLLLLILRKRKEKHYEEIMKYRKKKRKRDNKNSQKIRKPKRDKGDKVEKKIAGSRRSRRLRGK
ncbi:DUF916 and DUF3324 domain-containing protein [Enterococcus quebecensis]|uniref:Uncharacterized protein n=1 Tax=Enterococcus quebecensis TaxID=903983 RepID=A0A1E5GTQ0_9ENTE|nr:DUF916 and DUF3324 domain-containing protein [Enterococcus quebecensis]OEG16074.1 hypothetical protein BCR23_07970 [Enterococcus quebecensis]OJG75057.1 hypothetical protein RV12_GL002102 [Enterococcus quebecensis]